MASKITAAERAKLQKFTKMLVYKLSQIVIQSRSGTKITVESNAVRRTARQQEAGSTSPDIQWFNLSIPEDPTVNIDTKRALNGDLTVSLPKRLCIEVLLKTSDGDDMVLEYWMIGIFPDCCNCVCSSSAMYFRMSTLLKSILCISRITPAYKLARAQQKESYKISYRIYCGEPNINLLGEKYKTVKVSELRTAIGTIIMEVVYRTKMTILPNQKYNTNDSTGIEIMVKSDHFRKDSPSDLSLEKITIARKNLDLSKPLTAGAFVDTDKIKQLHAALSQQLPPEPPMTWLLAVKEKLEEKMSRYNIEVVDVKPGTSTEGATSAASHASSMAIEVPKSKDGDKYSSLMEFPFADGSPIAELANFYQECMQARSTSDEWTDIVGEVSASTDSELLSQQLKMFEDAVPEFDSMVASMISNSENGSEFF